MAKIIAVVNHKGGVAKTTTTATAAAILTQEGRKVLVVDLDAQANLTTCFNAETEGRTIYEALKERKDLPVLQTSSGVAVVPSSLDLAIAEIELSSLIAREYILKDLLEPVAGSYDFILLDCPPSLGLLTLNALCAADEVLIPCTAEGLAAQGLRRLADTINEAKKRANPSLHLAGVLLTQWKNRNLNKAVEEGIRAAYGDLLFSTRIRESVQIAEASTVKKTALEYCPDCNAVKDYKDFVAEYLRGKK